MTGDRTPKTILLASPLGFCAGVVRAIDIVELAPSPGVARVRESARSALARS